MMRRPAGQLIDIETARFRLRTLKPADASVRWQSWGKDSAVMGPLNAPVRDMPLDYLAKYAASFDNEHRNLIGIFDKAFGTHERRRWPKLCSPTNHPPIAIPMAPIRQDFLRWHHFLAVVRRLAGSV
jgi:hypothetical protein